MIVTITRRVNDPGQAGKIEDYSVSRGGILLDFRATWAPRSYNDIQLPEETIKTCDIHMYLTDMSTGLSVIGARTGANADPLIVPTYGTQSWSNPLANEVITSKSIIEKLGVVAQSINIPGLIIGGLRSVVLRDPIRTGTSTEAGVSFTFTMLVFDANAT